MARRSSIQRAIFLLYCIVGSVISVPNIDSRPEEQGKYVTRTPPSKVIDIPPATRTTPPPLIASELKAETTLVQSTSTTIKTTTTTTPEPTTQKSSLSLPIYRVENSNGHTCILLQVDALINIQYRNKLGEDDEAGMYIPEDVKVTGNCENRNTVTMSLKWNAYLLAWSFSKTSGGEHWYVGKIELTFNSSDKHFHNIDQPNKTIRLGTTQKYFFTPVGHSYVCDKEIEIPMTDGKNRGTLTLSKLKLQPFKFRSNEFAAEFSCESFVARGERDETAPVAVGSTLAAATLLTITGYAAYRYIKVKKVKYDTME
ncbi:lysosome-associated membrane glycoprotein 5 [Prorops nasuta]|uniref:lysosome-associated membrane glycoprotein 5 n=1 Tax=Prorops nasuta TaxID=863751 RepID=UPI0034CD71E4